MNRDGMEGHGNNVPQKLSQKSLFGQCCPSLFLFCYLDTYTGFLGQHPPVSSVAWDDHLTSPCPYCGS